jgi:hypothetical protein
LNLVKMCRDMPFCKVFPTNLNHWLSARAFSVEDIYPNIKNGLSPYIKIYLGIQYASSGSVLLSVSSHLLSSSTFFISSLVLSSSGHSIRCAAVSHLPQVGHHLSGDTSSEYFPTLTHVPQNPDVCLELQTLYMSTAAKTAQFSARF